MEWPRWGSIPPPWCHDPSAEAGRAPVALVGETGAFSDYGRRGERDGKARCATSRDGAIVVARPMTYES